MGKRGSFLGACLGLALFVQSGCMTPEPNLAPKDVMTRPDVIYGDHRNVAVFVDMKDLPEDQREPAIVWAVENGFRERGFDILDHNGYMAFLKRKALSPGRLEEPRLLAVLKNELGKSAIVRVHVGIFTAQGRTVDPLKTVTPGVPGSRGTGDVQIYSALRDRREWVIDLSLAFEMIDAATGARIWSCGLTCFQSAYEGKLQDFLKKAVSVCLDTIPAR